MSLSWWTIYLFTAKVERPMALNLANDDDGSSHGDVAQIKESGESYPGKVCSVYYTTVSDIYQYIHVHCKFS